MEIKIKVFIDTNILVSSILYPNSVPFLVCSKATKSPFAMYTSDYCINELHNVIVNKFPSKLLELNVFLYVFLPHINVIKTSDKELEEERLIRDIDDRKVYRGAFEANVDIFVTGDKDLLEAPIQYPKIIKPKDFLENY